MPVYHFTGVAAGNKKIRSTIDAESLRAARQKLKQEGIFPTSIAEGRATHRASALLSRLQLPSFQRIPDLQLSMFTAQLATLLSAGVPLVQALAALTEQVESERLRTISGQVRDSVNRGTSLADAMAEHPHVFDELYRAMVRSGEASGALPLVLERLAEYVEARLALRNKLVNAMIYPALLLGASALVAGVLLVKVIPTITGLLQDMNQPLPAATRVVIGVSDFLVAWWLHLLIGAGIGAIALNRFVQTPGGRLVWDRLRLRAPVVGRLIRYVAISRFARTLSTLQTGGLNIVSALDIARNVTGNAIIAGALDEAREALTRGSSLAGTLQRSGEFPPLVSHMVSVGEASGELDRMLSKLADTFDQLVDNSVSRLTALMGPVLLVIVAGVVVAIILSTLLPLLNLTRAL